MSRAEQAEMLQMFMAFMVGYGTFRILYLIMLMNQKDDDE